MEEREIPTHLTDAYESNEAYNRAISNALATPEQIEAHYAKPENSLQQASTEQIAEWVRSGGTLLPRPVRPDLFGYLFGSLT